MEAPGTSLPINATTAVTGVMVVCVPAQEFSCAEAPHDR